MNIPPRLIQLSSILTVSGMFFAAMVCSRSGEARAQTAAPGAPGVVSISAKKATGSYESAVQKSAPPSSQGGGGGGGGGKKGGGGSGGGGGSTTDTKTKTWVEITVRNSGNGSAKGVVVNYSVYVRTNTSGSGAATISYSKVDGSETIDDIEPGKTATVLSKPVDKNSSVSETSSGGKKGGASSGGSSSVTDIAGWYIEYVYNGATKHSENPAGIKATAEKGM